MGDRNSRFAGKVVVVTGGAMGIGRSVHWGLPRKAGRWSSATSTKKVAMKPWS